MVLGDAHQRSGVLREAASAPARTGIEERRADARVGADALHHGRDVGADGLAHRGHRVHERDLHREEAVGGVLDRLGRRRVGDQDLGVEAGVESRHPFRGVVVGRADHHPVGVQEVAHRRALAQELGVRHDMDVVSAHGALDDAGRADRDGRLVDDDGAGTQGRTDLGRRRLDVAEVGRAVVALGRRNAQEHDVRPGSSRGGAQHELEPTGGAGGGDDLGQPFFDDGDLTAVEQVDLVGVDVGAGHVVTQLRQTGPGRETDVARPHDRD